MKNVVIEAFRRSDAVFSGQVVEIGKFDVKLKVTKVWKGNVEETEINISRWYYTKESSETEKFIECSYQSFQVSKSYLFYADLFKNRLQVNGCSRSQFYDRVESDLKVLDSLKPKERRK